MKILCINPDRKHDYLSYGIIQGLKKKSNINLFFTSSGNGADNIIDEKDFYKLQEQVDFIFILHGKKKGKYHLFSQIEDWNKVVVVDGSENTFEYIPPFDKEALINNELLNKCKVYFKRECYPEFTERKIIPLPFTALDEDFGGFNLKKNIDILCAFPHKQGLVYNNEPESWREVAIRVCNELGKEGYKVITHRVPFHSYLQSINSSWITVDAWGSGEINARLFQIPANKSLGFYKRFNVEIPNFTENKEYIGWDTDEELYNKLKFYLDNKDKISYITNTGYDTTVTKHTSEKRVDYILSKLV